MTCQRGVWKDARGFSMIELLTTTAILLVVTGAVFAVVNPSQGLYRTQPEVSDMQQRLRVGTGAIAQDLVMAGAGTYLGGAGGSLLNFFAPVLPFRIGTLNSDIDAGVFYRDNTISIMYVPQTASQCTIRDRMPQPSSEVKVNREPGCPVLPPPDDDALCGFEEGMRVVIFDETGAFDPFTVTEVQEDALHLQHRDDDFSKAYDVGAQISQVALHTYYLLENVAAGTFQLRHYDGYLDDQPIAENVTALQFEYLGDPRPAILLKPVSAPTGPWTSYGPRPPAPGVDRTGDSYGPGENCAFMIDPVSLEQVSRLPDLAPNSEGLVPLTEAMLTDGPWCPDDASDNRYDVDLLRIRRVGVRMRVQVASAQLRGPAGLLFSHGGTSRGGTLLVPDQEIRFDITPRNMNLGR